MENLKEIEQMNEFDLHMPSEVLPIQVKQNKSVVGKISLSNFPTGARSGFGQDKQTQFEINVQNSQQMLLSSAVICCDLKIDKGLEAGKFVNFRGAQTILKSLTVSLDNKKLVDIQNHADKVADFNLVSSSTKDELDQAYGTMAFGRNMQLTEGAVEDIVTVRIDLKRYGLDIGNLIPTGTIGSILTINGTINDSAITQFSEGTTGANNIVPPGTIRVEYNNIRLESEFVELQPMLLSKRIEKIKSSSGLTIPFHTFAVDARLLSNVATFNERIAMSYNNIVALYQLPYNKDKGRDYYSKLLWNANNTMDKISDYYVKFDGGQYYNLNSNTGQSGYASHAQALINATRSEFTSEGHAGVVIKGMNDYQVLACNFVRSNNVLSPSITDSGVNARLQSGIIGTEARFKTAITDKQLITIVKFTRRIVFKNGSMEVFS
ncbi:MAG: hypothetical protein GY739_17650 [Mesoflavibacter sp.]|nr:hypothetical protein [Mesoflavibacter sp.]